MTIKPNIIIYGTGRQHRDFECIFPQFHVLGYIIPDQTSVSSHHNNKPVWPLHNLHSNELIDKDASIVVCGTQKSGEKVAELEKRGLQYGEHYFVAEDIFSTLDSFHKDLSRTPVVIWGTGSATKIFLNLYEENWHESINITCFMDNARHQQGAMFAGKPIVHPDKWNWARATEYFFVVTSTFYEEIKKQLQSHGLREFEHFIYCSTALIRPSLMLKKIMNTASVPGPQCPMNSNVELRADGVFPCTCAPHLTLPIGDLYLDDFESIWRSKAAAIFRLSLVNHTYCFCRLASCFYKEYHTCPTSYSHDAIKAPETITRISFSLDETCNLFCDKCRNSLLKLSPAKVKQRITIMEKLLKSPLIQSASEMYLAGGGELFASDIYKCTLFSKKRKVRNKGLIITNLQLFNEQKFWALKQLFNDIDLTISIDGATKQTYESIQRGGSFQRLKKNLQIVSDLRKKELISQVHITMVIQKKNYQEIPLVVQWMEDLGFDDILLEKIRNWGTFEEEDFASNVSMFGTDLQHPKPEFQIVFENLMAIKHRIKILHW